MTDDTYNHAELIERLDKASDTDEYLISYNADLMSQAAEMIEALVSERDGLAADRVRAPHTPECGIWKYKHDRDRAVLTASGLCNCWKSAAPSDALDEVKREAGAAAIERIVPFITESGWAQKRANAIRSGDE